jgi:hypothetical protein
MYEHRVVREAAMPDVLRSNSTDTSDGLGYCLGGMAALLVGFFIFGIPCGLLAIRLGNEGIKRGATTFGPVVKVGGWVETLGTTLVLGATLAAAASLR